MSRPTVGMITSQLKLKWRRIYILKNNKGNFIAPDYILGKYPNMVFGNFIWEKVEINFYAYEILLASIHVSKILKLTGKKRIRKL